tara:strand:+ start:84 stop:338 length:255 start_codon:yes stop_codon:yes gene_type:complete
MANIDIKNDIITILNNLNNEELKQIKDYLNKCYVNKGKHKKYNTEEEKYMTKLEQNKKYYWKTRTPEKLEQIRINTYNRRHNIT